jgi:hypothetical protein
MNDDESPYQCDPRELPYLAFEGISIDRPRFVVAVAGGTQYVNTDAAWVMHRLNNLLREKMRSHIVHLACSPSPGAAAIVHHEAYLQRRPAQRYFLDFEFGRAASFRCAWDMLAAADAVVLFEPLDAVGFYAERLSQQFLVPLKVARVRQRPKTAPNKPHYFPEHPFSA